MNSSESNPIKSGSARPASVSPRDAATMQFSITTQERFLLSRALSKAILGFAKLNRAIYLENLGIIFPITQRIKRSYLVKNSIAIRLEGVMRLDFEKCSELHSLHRERFGKVADTRDLVAEVFPRLPVTLQLRWRADDVRALLLQHLRLLRQEIVSRGYSRALEELGTFYAMHNRHGSSPEDWYAGADIFLVSKFERLKEFGEVGFFPRPQVGSSWEIFEAAFGQSLGCFDLQIQDELRELGISLPEDSKLSRLGLEVAVFRLPAAEPKGDGSKPSRSDTETLIYCTNGLRAIASESFPPVELIFQIEVPREANGKNRDTAPRWPGRALAMAAALRERQGTKGSQVATFGFPHSLSLTNTRRSALGGILLNSYRQSPLAHLTPNGEFSLMSVVGITADEVAIAQQHSPQHLLALLGRRGFAEVTKTDRLSVLHRTTILPEDLPKIQSDTSSEPVLGWH